jgi:hypothetical protein
LVVGGWLLVAGCWLLVYRLPVTGCQLPVANPRSPTGTTADAPLTASDPPPWCPPDSAARSAGCYRARAQRIDSTAILGTTPHDWIESAAAHADSFACGPLRRMRVVR